MRVQRLASADDVALDEQPGLVEPTDDVVAGLAALLVDAVADGASVGFLSALTPADAAQWWTCTLRSPGSITWVARTDDDRVVGCVRLTPAAPPNASHRADVSKLLVHRAARGQRVASLLMASVEAEARRLGRTLLLLDTQTGSPAERIYAGWGWEPYGAMADHAMQPDGRLDATTFMLKRLPP